jgi:molybdenum cofactor cytidylyltransferase
MSADPVASRAQPVAGILLAAGMSTRMGVNKLLLEVDGEAVVRRAARAATEAGLAPLVVVLGHQAELTRRQLRDLDCAVVVNDDYRRGIASSLRTGVAALPPDCRAVVVALADMPQVTSAMIAELVARYRETRARLVASRYEGVYAPPVLYDASLFAELGGLADTVGAQQVVKRHLAEAEVLSWSSARLADLDAPEDYERLRSARPESADHGAL